MRDVIDQLTLLTPDEMGRADQLAISDGISGYTLMKTAGDALFQAICANWPNARNIVVVCGPGNNGGDGFVVAQSLKTSGFHVTLGLLGNPNALSGDAALAYADWSGDTRAADELNFNEADLLVDALFGAGLARPLTGAAATLVDAMNSADAPILAVDLPSGLDGRTGKADGPFIKAARTVSFFRKKPGHLLLPGRDACGPVEIADIGIPGSAVARLGITLFENTPPLWQHVFPRQDAQSHKYTKGHALIVSGPEFQTGASRLTAKAALRTGAGLVSIAGAPEALRIHAAHLTAIMLKPLSAETTLEHILSDERLGTIAIGPGLGLSPDAQELVQTVCLSKRRLVLDADAITLLAEDRSRAFQRLSDCAEPPILTPHEGEFKRLFPDSVETSKVERARKAAQISNSVIVLKGADTVIAAPDGRAAINTNAPHWLATAGSGDTLTGIITGLRAQNMPAFEAACAGVWLHGEAGLNAGPYLTADDLEDGLWTALKALSVSLN